ncbi:MAG: hypothetical protein AABN95_12665 [Acidobacteriota bacterium]
MSIHTQGKGRRIAAKQDKAIRASRPKAEQSEVLLIPTVLWLNSGGGAEELLMGDSG